MTQALTTVLTNPKQVAEMRRSWSKVDFESVRNQSALVCNCRHEDLVQLLEVEFVALLDGLLKSTTPVPDVMSWADKCCERLMGSRGGEQERGTMSSRSVLIRWGYVTSQVMRDLVCGCRCYATSWFDGRVVQTIRSDPAFGAFQILKLFLEYVTSFHPTLTNVEILGSDWIALNVLRSVALSTNSVAASVEPVMQQNFFTMSPEMTGQENFGQQLEVQHPVMAHTPTTSSMLAALQQDTFTSGPLDPSSSAFGADAFSSLSYMDTSPSHDESMPVHPSALSFPDYVSSSGSFDAPAFTPEQIGLHSASATPPSSSEPENSPEPVKTENPL